MAQETQPQQKTDYKATLNLPETSFPMRAGAATREPELQQLWADHDVYGQSVQRRTGKEPFVLHDGPPYLSSPAIHIGTALNKVLKDIVTRYHYQRGYWAPYVPGYDGHGLPIENAVVKSLKGGRDSVTPVELRQQCRSFALENLKGQEAEFKRLGVWGDWAHPYLTIDQHCVATQIRGFQQMVDKGYIYKGLKPVYWDPVHQSALAEAEIEYKDVESHSIYVAFGLPHTTKLFGDPLTPEQASWLDGARFVIWTTTPWTLPANVAMAVHPELDYVVVETQGHGRLILAAALLEDVTTKNGITVTQTLGTLKGRALEGLVGQHPFIDRVSYVLAGPHVTSEAGTGVVHTAPGHGVEDYEMVTTYNRDATLPFAENPIPILSPVDDRGCYREADVTGAPWLAGLFYEKANPRVLEELQSKQALLGAHKFTHSYPHAWRSHAPVIYRATAQWFVNVDDFRRQAMDAIATVEWIPARGERRIAAMVGERSDWCISRQRAWGVPIPAFYCTGCEALLLTQATTNAVAEKMEAQGTDVWWQLDAQELLTAGTTCPECGNTAFTKETDIMDVWFDSGMTHTSVVEARKDELGGLPVAMYLEGSDQHRGWFQSSLLTSVMLRGTAPYERVLTHGFVLDEQGRKMSKSLGNVVAPADVIRQYGADVLRLWVASVDYSVDVRVGPAMMGQLAEVYKKVRNTIRFILGNLSGFDPQAHHVPAEARSALDRYILGVVAERHAAITEAFDAYQFHKFYQILQNLCVNDLSSLYFDICKDALYCDPTDSPRRRAIQSTLYDMLQVLLPMLVPVMPHMAEDIWQHLPENQRWTDVPAAVLLDWPALRAGWKQGDDDNEAFQTVLGLREQITGLIEPLRKAGELGSSLEAQVQLSPEAKGAVSGFDKDTLADWWLVSGVDDGGDALSVELSTLAKCERCWKRNVPETSAEPLCQRCQKAVHAHG